jgi:hypothetical protein
MQRIRLGRISAAVAALALAGAIQHAEEIQAMATGLDTDGAVVPGQIRVSLDHFGAIAGIPLPFAGGQLPDFGPTKCRPDARLQQRVCASRRPSDSTYAALVVEQRSTTGGTQLDFDGLTTDTVLSRMALVRRGADRNGHMTDLTLRSTQRWGGVAYASASMTLNGADTTYSAVYRASGVNRFTGIVHYSDVRLARHPGNLTRTWPTGGVLYATSTNEWVTAASTRPFYSNVIVYFDGTRTPDAYLDGQRFSLDLVTGIATPKPID